MYICNKLLSDRVISAQEAAFTSLNIDLVNNKIDSVHVPALTPDDRKRLMKSKKEIEDEAKRNPNSCQVYKYSLLDRYSLRPDVLEHLTLFEFARDFTIITGNDARSKIKKLNEGKIAGRNEHFIGKDNTFIIRKTNMPNGVKYNQYPPENTEKFAYQQLLLFYPWRNESSDVVTHGTAHATMEYRKAELRIPKTIKKQFETKFKQFEKNLIKELTELAMAGCSQEAFDEVMKQFKPESAARIAQMVCEAIDKRNESMENEQRINIDEQQVNDNVDVVDETDSNRYREYSFNFHEIEALTRAQMDMFENKYDTEFNNDYNEDELHQPIRETISQSEYQQLISSLNSLQLNVFEFFSKTIKRRRETNVISRAFVTGGAGTGKSHLISAITHLYNQHYGVGSVFKMAPTGIAAFNINGVTIHSGLKLSVSRYKKKQKITNLNNKALTKLEEELKDMKLIVIDEISMVSASMLSDIHKRLCEVFKTDEQFGGRNVLLVGDFLQLKPVPSTRTKETLAFEEYGDTHLWSLFTPFKLENSVRQADDQNWCRLLSRVRCGHQTEEDHQFLESLVEFGINEAFSYDLSSTNPFQNCIRLFPLNSQVNMYNTTKFNLLPGPRYWCEAEDVFEHTETKSKRKKKEGQEAGMPNILMLAVGARIMLRRNLNTASGLVNGATGIIERINWPSDVELEIDEENNCSTKLLPSSIIIKFDNHKIQPNPYELKAMTIKFFINSGSLKGTCIERTTFPIQLSFATTIHKVQGLTLEYAVADLSEVFEEGHVYVALSRVRSSKNIKFSSYSREKLKVDQTIVDYLNKMKLL